jgi:type IV pilus assembly protein PilW
VELEDAQEIAAGIEDMQVLYGHNTGGDLAPEEYVRADELDDTEWPNVVSIQVALLTMGTDDGVGQDYPEDFRFALLDKDDVDPPADGRVRRVVSFTVALRNRVS